MEAEKEFIILIMNAAGDVTISRQTSCMSLGDVGLYRSIGQGFCGMTGYLISVDLEVALLEWLGQLKVMQIRKSYEIY